MTKFKLWNEWKSSFQMLKKLLFLGIGQDLGVQPPMALATTGPIGESPLVQGWGLLTEKVQVPSHWHRRKEKSSVGRPVYHSSHSERGGEGARRGGREGQREVLSIVRGKKLDCNQLHNANLPHNFCCSFVYINISQHEEAKYSEDRCPAISSHLLPCLPNNLTLTCIRIGL